MWRKGCFPLKVIFTLVSYFIDTFYLSVLSIVLYWKIEKHCQFTKSATFLKKIARHFMFELYTKSISLNSVWTNNQLNLTDFCKWNNLYILKIRIRRLIQWYVNKLDYQLCTILRCFKVILHYLLTCNISVILSHLCYRKTVVFLGSQ